MAFQVGKDSSGIFLNIKTTVLRCVHRFVRKKFVFKNWFEVLAVVHSDWICYSCILSVFIKAIDGQSSDGSVSMALDLRGG